MVLDEGMRIPKGAPSTRRNGQRLVVVAWAVVAVSAVVRVSVIASSFFWQDDYVHIFNAWAQPFGQFVTQDWNGHLQPGSLSVYWVLTRIWPQQFWPAVVVLGAIAVAIPVVFWKALKRWVGVAAPVAMAVGALAIWPGFTVSMSWLAAGLEMVSILFLLLAMWAYTLPSRWRIPLVLLCLAAGLLFNERSLFMLPLLFLVAVLFDEGTVAMRVHQVWRASRSLWLWLLVVTGVLAAGLLSRTPAASGGERATLWEFLEGLWFGSVLGGLRSVAGTSSAWPDDRTTVPDLPGVWAVLWLVLVWAVLAFYGWRRSRRQALLVVACWLLMLVAESLVVDLFRGGFIGPTVHMDARYFVVSVIVLLSGVASFARVPAESSPRSRLLLSCVLVGVCLASLSSAWAIRTVVSGAASRAWLTAAQGAFAVPGSPPLTSTSSPPFMLNDLFVQRNDEGQEYELGTVRTLLQVGPQQPRFGEPTLFPVGVDEQGGPAAVTVNPVKSETRLAFGENCSVRVTEQWRAVPMSQAGLGNPVLSIDYLAPGPASVQVRAGSWSASLRLETGLKSMWFTPPPGPWSGFDVRLLEGPGVCLGSARAGVPAVVPKG